MPLLAAEATQPAPLPSKREVNNPILFCKSDSQEIQDFRNRIREYIVILPARVDVKAAGWVASKPPSLRPCQANGREKTQIHFENGILEINEQPGKQTLLAPLLAAEATQPAIWLSKRKVKDPNLF